MKLFTDAKKYFLGSILLFIFSSCEDNWPTKNDVKYLHGEWKLISVTATDIVTKKDTTWNTKECFIRFGYTGKDGATPLTYALTPNDVVNILYSLPQKDNILFMPKDPVSEYDNSKIGFQLSKYMPYEVVEDHLTLKGDGLIREGNKIIHEGRKVNLTAIFKKVK